MIAHSEKEQAAGTHKRTYGFHPLLTFLDHGAVGTGEPLAILLRPGNAGSNTAEDHITVAKDALAQVPGINPSRPGKKVLIRADGAGGTKDFTTWAHRCGVQCSVGFTLPGHTPDLLKQIPEQAWAPAYDAEGQVRPGAAVAELTDLLTLTGWPTRMQVIARRERPHPGAQAALHRRRRVPHHRVRDQHTQGPAGRPRAAPPPPRPRRGPDPHRQGHRPDQPAPAWVRPE